MPKPSKKRGMFGLETRLVMSAVPPFSMRLGSFDPPVEFFEVACFPLKIQGGSAGPARVVAILPEESSPQGTDG
jgi:hypothetical protein